MAETVISRNRVPIRLTDERWAHISEEHAELTGMRDAILDAVADPSRICAGTSGELLALKQAGEGKWLVAVYREMRDDGFVITAFLTRRIKSFERRKQLWP